MLKVRIIPCLDVHNGRVVKGVQFVDLRDAGDPVEQARVYDAAGADELTFLDITASHENRDTILDVVARTAEQCFMPLTVGAGEILLTSMDRDGTKSGFDLDLTRAVSDAVPVPVVASGGVGTLDHLVDGVTKGGASAVLAASIFHFGEFTIAQAKEHLARAGVPIRQISRAA